MKKTKLLEKLASSKPYIKDPSIGCWVVSILENPDGDIPDPLKNPLMRKLIGKHAPKHISRVERYIVRMVNSYLRDDVLLARAFGSYLDKYIRTEALVSGDTVAEALPNRRKFTMP